MLTQVLQHVPVWVFGLLALLVAFGLAQTVPRRLTLRRSAVLPLGLTALSLAGVLSAFGAHALPLLAWAGGLVAAVATLRWRVDVSGVHFDRHALHFTVPGSWAPLALMLGLFSVKFVVGFLRATQPATAAALPVVLAACAAYGLFSGVFFGRAMELWALARHVLPALRAA